jgi:DNA-binding NarL/FixJ family response regulator
LTVRVASAKSWGSGILLKDSAENDLIEAIKALNDGKAFFSPEISKVLAEDYVREIAVRGVEDSYDLFSPRGAFLVLAEAELRD